MSYYIDVLALFAPVISPYLSFPLEVMLRAFKEITFQEYSDYSLGSSREDMVGRCTIILSKR